MKAHTAASSEPKHGSPQQTPSPAYNQTATTSVQSDFKSPDRKCSVAKSGSSPLVSNPAGDWAKQQLEVWLTSPGTYRLNDHMHMMGAGNIRERLFYQSPMADSLFAYHSPFQACGGFRYNHPVAYQTRSNSKYNLATNGATPDRLADH